MRRDVLAFSAGTLVALGAASLAPAPAGAGEIPSVQVQANAPGWITVSYQHGDSDDVSVYSIARVGGQRVYLDAFEGHWTDAGLTPNTTYSYIVCAHYKDGEQACTPQISATTLKLPNPPARYDPPIINNVQVSTDEIKVFWGPTGDYAKIHIQLSDPDGNVDQREIDAVRNGSYSFPGMRSGVRYRVILQGCSANVFSPDGCGPWSPNVFVTTALPPGAQPPPAPPSNVTLVVKALNSKTVSLEFTVQTSTVTDKQKFLIQRDRQPYAEVTKLKGIIGGYGGSYADSVGTAERAHDYRVCFAQQPFKQVCSATMAGPEPSVGIQRMPTDVRSKPVQIDPDNTDRVTRPPFGVKPAPRPGTVLGR